MAEQREYRTTVEFGEGAAPRSYTIWIRPGLLDAAGPLLAEACPAHRYALVADSQVAPLYGQRLLAALAAAGLSASLFKFPAGEWNKSRESWGDLTDAMLRAGVGRDGAIVALGGGVTGDLAGFVAATYMRGIPVVQVPTTLLAMIDSSVGGKTGVDTRAGKNLVGAFHQPRAVLIDPALLNTLPDPQLASGLAEALKHGLILDAEYFDRLTAELERVFARDLELLAGLIARSVELKAEVVAQDERESGYRRILNFGHTVGHAQETISGYAWLHGEAVAAGMALEAEIGEAAGLTRPGVAERVRQALEAARLPLELDSDVDETRFMKALEMDKKRQGEKVRFTLLADVGRVAGSAEAGWTQEVPDELLRSVLFRAGGGRV